MNKTFVFIIVFVISMIVLGFLMKPENTNVLFIKLLLSALFGAFASWFYSVKNIDKDN